MVDALPPAVQDRYHRLIHAGVPYKVAIELAWAPKLGTDGKLPADVLGSGTTGPGSTSWLQAVGGQFGFAFTTVTTTDSATGLPTAAAVRWPDGTTGAFTGTIDSGGNGYSGFVVTWAGTTTKTLTASGITYDANGTALGPTSLAVS